MAKRTLRKRRHVDSELVSKAPSFKQRVREGQEDRVAKMAEKASEKLAIEGNVEIPVSNP